MPKSQVVHSEPLFAAVFDIVDRVLPCLFEEGGTSDCITMYFRLFRSFGPSRYLYRNISNRYLTIIVTRRHCWPSADSTRLNHIA